MPGMAPHHQASAEYLDTRIVHLQFKGAAVEHHVQLDLALHNLQQAGTPAQVGIQCTRAVQVQC
ncbi:hypothetical protein D3C75_1343760 [compost metagenome]